MISIYLNSFKRFVTEIHFRNFHSFQDFTISFIQSQDILFMFPQKWKTSVYQVILVFNQFLPMFAMKLLSFDTSASLLICYTSIKPHIDHLLIYVDAHPCTGAIRWPTLNGAATLLSGNKLPCLVMVNLLLSEKMKHEFSFS